MFFAALHFGVTFIRMIVWYFELYIFNMASEKTVKNIRESLYTKLHSLGMRFFDQTSTGWIITRATNDTEAMKDFWNVFLTIMQGVFGVVISLSAMFILDASVAVWILLFAPVLLIVIRFYQVYSSKTYVSMKSKLSSLNTKLAETINGMSIIQQFRQERRLQKEFEETNRSYFDSRYSMVGINAILLSPIINFLYTIAVVLILAIFGINALNSPIEVGIIYAFTSYANDFFRPLTN